MTGTSATGKSALLDIVDFCLGRSTLTMAVGPISDRVAWYAVIVQLPGGQAFVARPAARQGAASTQLAMLELGTDLSPIPFERLEANADIGTVREQLGRRIGIEENEHEAPVGSLRSGLEANLGHAMFLCLQGQGEIANRGLLFHRQGEPGIADAIKDTLPYFLGAVPRDQGALRQRLADARRELAKSGGRPSESARRERRRRGRDAWTCYRSHRTWTARRAMLTVGEPSYAQRFKVLRPLEAAQPVGDDTLAARRSELESRRSDLRARLRSVGEEIRLLDSLQTDGNEYGAAVSQQISRLKSIDLLGAAGSGDESCPLCGAHLDEPDPTVDELRRQADQLQSQLLAMDVALPARRAATGRLQREADALRQELLGVDAAANGLDSDQQAAGVTRRLDQQQVFFRGAFSSTYPQPKARMPVHFKSGSSE